MAQLALKMALSHYDRHIPFYPGKRRTNSSRAARQKDRRNARSGRDRFYHDTASSGAAAPRLQEHYAHVRQCAGRRAQVFPQEGIFPDHAYSGFQAGSPQKQSLGRRRFVTGCGCVSIVNRKDNESDSFRQHGSGGMLKESQYAF